MKIAVTEIHWAEQHAECSLADLAELAHLTETELRELVELGVVQPAVPASLQPPSSSTSPGHGRVFSVDCLVKLRTVRRLRDDFELDAQGASVALALLERIEELERQLRALRARHPDL